MNLQSSYYKAGVLTSRPPSLDKYHTIANNINQTITLVDQYYTSARLMYDQYHTSARLVYDQYHISARLM